MRVLVIGLLPLAVWAEGALDRASTRVHDEDQPSPPPSTLGDDNGHDDLFLSITSSTTEMLNLSNSGGHSGHPDTMFADSVAPASQVTEDARTRSRHSEAPWIWSMGVSAVRRDAGLRRWGADLRAGRDLLIDLRFDGYRESTTHGTVLANVTALGAQYGFGLVEGVAPLRLGAAWLIWYDAIGFEGGLGVTAGWSPQWQWVRADIDLCVGNLHDEVYQRYAVFVGPAWGPVAVQVGYEHTDVAGVLLGGPGLRLDLRF